MGSAMNNGAQVKFTRQQVDWLNKHFPEVTGTPSTTDVELRFRSGQRSVIAFILTRVAEQQEN